MKKLDAKRLTYVVVLVAAHVAAISGGILLRSQTVYAQMETDVRWGTRTVINGLPACDCTKPQPKECVCQLD